MEFIGVVFVQLFKVAVELAKSMKFQPILGQIESTLVSLKPLIEEMVGLNMGLELKSQALDKLQDEILEGLVLVRKCVKCSKVDFLKRIKYKKKLEKLDEFLKSLLQELKVEETRNVMLNLLLTKETSKKVDEMANDVKEILLGTEKHGGLLEELLQGEEESLLLIRKNYDQIERSEKEQKQFRGLVEWSMVNVPSKDDLPPINWDEVKASTLPVGFDKPMEELKTDLLKNGFQMLVLTGLQGSGKTTLAKHFCEDKDVKGTFKDNIFLVHVSKQLSCGDIVRRIVRKLNKYKKTESPDNIDDTVIAVEWLQQFLNKAGQNPILLVLDDVWPGSEFLLKKFNECKMSNCKILVTSIYNFPGFSSRYYFEPLDEYNAIILLQHSASRYKPACFTDDFARKVVERCRGFPLAIEEVGRSLGDRATESWDKSLSNWYENSTIIDSETDFFGFLQSSKDTLNEQMDTVKECFMDLGSFPENQRIPVAALIEIWAVLYKLEDAPSISNLYELTNQSLANHIFTMKEKIDVNGYYSEHFVTQHYLLRQLAIYETGQDPVEHRKRMIIDICGNNLPKWLKEHKDQPVKARLLSISTDNNFTENWHNMQLPEVEVLILNFHTKAYALPGFVKTMDKLKVLIVTNYGSEPAELRQFHLLDKLSDLKTIRLQNISLASISKNSLALKSLQKISLSRCSMAKAFSARRIQISDAFPNLVEINIDCCNDLEKSLDKFCSLTSLKKLSITNCDLSMLSEEIGELKDLELLRLRSCRDLHKLPDSIRKLKMLDVLDISDCLSLRTLPEDIGEMKSLRKLDVRQCNGLEKLPQSILNLKQLEEVLCDEVTENLWEPFLAKLSIKVTKEDIST
ncbi:putative powdery mildew resistance protein, RPW8 [Rosa chinensis]|uniref:Putative powdery mildew resistance protein, RPW8 n=1 Tax=Rosa chinensis TaxID=74649 RepID=A0A2P6SA87_ROSCH|nr:probable disease resistance protein At5g66900 [Rosa chinensis]PRQ55608.1 putative powdery mildew resistance protein, RPW8 [Rosa chinensis]